MFFNKSLQQIARSYDFTLLVSFGSYNTDRFTAESDIDLGYLSKTALDASQQLALMQDFISLFGRDKIDLVDLSIASPLLLYEVACNSQVLYEEDDSYLKFKLRASARYADTKWLRKKRRAYLNDLIEGKKG